MLVLEIKKIWFLGHQVDGDGIHTMNETVTAIKNFPRLKSVENVRSFIGLCGYYRSFINKRLCKTRVCSNATTEKCFVSLEHC